MTNICYNNPIIGSNSSSLGPTNIANHFPSIFKPISNTTDEANNETPRGLSLWMSDNHHTVMPSHGNINNLHDHQIHQNPLVSSHHQNHHQQLNWVFGNKISSPCQELSVPSLYSSQHHHHHHHHQTTSANMSATALLQKAAQIGATSTTSDPSFLGSLGLKCSSNVINTSHQEDHDHNTNKYSGMYGSGSVLTSLGGGGSDQTENNSASELSQMPPAKRQQIVQNSDELSAVGGGQTRDFLGVGVQSICHPSSINGWI